MCRAVSKRVAKQCGVYTRTRISINHVSWDNVPKEEKEALWQIIKKHFKLEDDFAKKNNLLSCNLAWKRFRSTLKRDFMDKGISPYQKFTSITEQAWAEFVRREDTPERQAKRIKGRLYAKTQINHPHVGRIGYHGYEKIWDKEKQCEKLGTEYHDIQDERAQKWLLARTRLNEQGRTLLPDVGDFAQKLIQCDKNVSQELEDSEVYPLISVLGLEHGGRTRAVGSSVGWKKGIEGYAKRKKMSKLDIEEIKQIFNDLLKEALEEERKKQKAQNLQIHKQYQEELKNMRADFAQQIETLHKILAELTKGQINPLPSPQTNPISVLMQTYRLPNKPPRLQGATASCFI